MKVNGNDDCYAYMRLTHLISMCWGFPITRRKTKIGYKHDGDGDGDVQGDAKLHAVLVKYLN